MTEETVEVEAPKHKDLVLNELIAVVGEGNASDMELERVVYSGDPSALPQFHYRWKYKYLADYVVRVTKVEQIQAILRIARSHKLPVIPRGGASSCLGSSSPTRGGITLDLKRLDKVIEINIDESFVRLEPGVPFERLEEELVKQGLTIGIYPSSAKSAVIGGWIGCGGSAGIGTPLFGTLAENILEISVVKSDGEVLKYSGEDISLFNGSYGILGIINEVKMRVHPAPTGYRTFSFGFDQLEHLCFAMKKISELDYKPTYLKLADKDFQSYSNPLEIGKYVLSVTYAQNGGSIPEEDINRITSDSGGKVLDELYAMREWVLRYDCEFNPKEHCETLMFQELWVGIDKVYDILKTYESYKKSHKVPAIWFGMLGSPAMMRVELMAMLNPDQYLKFIASKAILHKMIKKSIKVGGGPYTIGLQNSIYMKRAFPERLQEMKAAKEALDPMNIMNPDRVTSCLTSYGRMNILFLLAAAFRRLSKFVGRN
ncbi:MAG: FAD-binding oxidoreductase [Candidatus Hodarchaeota archaeon]